jgi:hypothetical protein
MALVSFLLVLYNIVYRSGFRVGLLQVKHVSSRYRIFCVLRMLGQTKTLLGQ